MAGFGDVALRSPSNDTNMRSPTIDTPVDIEMEGITPPPSSRPPNINYEEPRGSTVRRVTANAASNLDSEITRMLARGRRGGRPDPFDPPVEVGSKYEKIAGRLLGSAAITAATIGSSLLVDHLKGRYIKNKKEKEEEERRKKKEKEDEEKRKKKEKEDAIKAALQAEKDRLKAEEDAKKEVARLEKLALKEAKAVEAENRKQAEVARREALYAQKIQAEIQAAKDMAARVPPTRQQMEEAEHIRQTNQANKPRPVKRSKSRRVG
jgi:hypothetical protein